jgi:hypothetical protein
VMRRTDHAVECFGAVPVPSSQRTGRTLKLVI